VRTTAETVVMENLLARDDSGTWIDRLSERELEVLKLMEAGHGNPEIGTAMHLETKTMERYTNGVYTKFGELGAEGHARVQAVTAYLAEGR
jgi:DNA-binding NarL/FixJ family response regulator